MLSLACGGGGGASAEEDAGACAFATTHEYLMSDLRCSRIATDDGRRWVDITYAVTHAQPGPEQVAAVVEISPLQSVDSEDYDQ